MKRDESIRAAALWWWLPILLLGAAVPTRGQQPAAAKPPIRILFVGNSFTHGKYMPVRKYNASAVTDENAGLPANDPRGFHPAGEEGLYGGIPGIFKKLTDEAGLNYEVHVEAVSAKNLAFHYENALSVIARPGWDVVVLQGYSTEPLPKKRGGKPESFEENAALLEKAIHAASPHAKIHLEETWARADLVYPDKAPYNGASVDAMTADLRAGYERAKTAGVERVVGVGDAWEQAIEQGVAEANPYAAREPGKLDLWGPDHYHPSIYGAYLNALVFLREIAAIDPVTLRADEPAARDLGISPMDAERLQHFGAVFVDGKPLADDGR